MVSAIFDYLSAGESDAEILRQYPVLKRGDLLGALGYAAWLAHEEEELSLHAGGSALKIVDAIQPVSGK